MTRTTYPAPTAELAAPVHPLSVALSARLAGSGWMYGRDLHTGHEWWIEPALTDGRRELRHVTVSEIPAVPRGRVVEASNASERVVLRCVADTDPTAVLATLDIWQVLPADGVTRRCAPASPSQRTDDHGTS